MARDGEIWMLRDYWNLLRPGVREYTGRVCQDPFNVVEDIDTWIEWEHTKQQRIVFCARWKDGGERKAFLTFEECENQSYKTEFIKRLQSIAPMHMFDDDIVVIAYDDSGWGWGRRHGT